MLLVACNMDASNFMQALLQQAGFWAFVNAAFPRNVYQKIAQITLHQVFVGGKIQQLVMSLNGI